MRERTALVFGIAGQDGSLLARHLLDHGYQVHGTSRDTAKADYANLDRVGVRNRAVIHSCRLSDFQNVLDVISRVAPAEIYNLAGQSSVGLSFEQPVETLLSNGVGTLHILEAVQRLDPSIRLFNAGSGECFGHVETGFADETTPFNPQSPYGVAKATAFWAVANYRNAYGLFACSGILFNHESPLRPRRFVTSKIIAGAADVAEGKVEHLRLGNLDVARDFGWAPEFVAAMHAMLTASRPADYVIATGDTRTLKEFVELSFAWFGLDWRRYVVVDSSLLRPSDIPRSAGCPDKARRNLGWQSKLRLPDIVDRLATAEVELRRMRRRD